MLSRTPLLLEAIKGGMDNPEHEVHGIMSVRRPVDDVGDDGSNYKEIPLTHNEEGHKTKSLATSLRKHADTFNSQPGDNFLRISMVHKGEPGKEKSRFHEGGHPARPVASLEIVHTGERHPESGLPIVKPFLISTHQTKVRKGWASTLFDHSARLLKKYMGLHLQHDVPSGQTPWGKRWAARQETARGQGYIPPHREYQRSGVRALAIAASFNDKFPHLSPHHEVLSNLANRTLDQAGGYYNKQHLSSFRKTAERLIGKPLSVDQAHPEKNPKSLTSKHVSMDRYRRDKDQAEEILKMHGGKREETY